MQDLKDKGTNNEWCFSMSRTVLQFEREREEAKVHEGDTIRRQTCSNV